MKLNHYALPLIVLLYICAPGLLKAEQLKIGVIIPLSGPPALMGESLRRSISLAKLANIETHFEDDRCEGKTALAAYLKLREQGVRIFYLACSGSILALAPHVKRNGDLVLTTYAGSSRIRETGDEVIRVNPDAISVAEGVEKLIGKAERPVAILYEEQEYASSLADKLESLLGKDLIKRVAYRPDAALFSAEILSIKGAKPRSIFLIPVADGPAKTILKQMAEYKIDVPVLGEVNLCDYSFKPAEYGLHGLCVAAKFQGEAYAKFNSDSVAIFGHPPAYPFYDAMAYDLFKFIDRQVAVSSSLGVPELKTKILAGFKGEFAEYQFSADGEITNASDYLVTVRY